MASNTNLDEKIYKYETFLNDVLKEDLKKIQIRLDQLYTEIAEFLQLKQAIEVMKSTSIDEGSLKTTVDVGCNFLMKAKINDLRTICVDVGCGYYVEYALSEALTVISKRIKHLEKLIENCKKHSAATKAHIKMVLLGLLELQKL